MDQQKFEETLRNSYLTQAQDGTKKKEVNFQVGFQDEEELNNLLGIVKDPNQKLKKPQKVQVAEGKLEFLFNPARDIQAARPYIEDGDSSLQSILEKQNYHRYTEDMMKIRYQLKNDKQVEEAINKFISLYKFDSKGKLIKDEYIRMQIRIIYLLRDDLIDDDCLEELKFILDQDWEHDSLGKGFMNKEDLYKSLFELVDIWTPNVDRKEYLGFFELLNEKIQLQNKQKLEKKYWDVIGSRFIC